MYSIGEAWQGRAVGLGPLGSVGLLYHTGWGGRVLPLAKFFSGSDGH